MTDRELLEDAAKAAGVDIEWQPCGWAHDNETGCEWNPLTDDGDALRLAVKLHMPVEAMIAFVAEREPDWEKDPLAATRRAITRAAAESGKAMP